MLRWVVQCKNCGAENETILHKGVLVSCHKCGIRKFIDDGFIILRTVKY